MHPTFAQMVGRILRLRCPACGEGSLFRRYFVRRETCPHCQWRYERGEGHWVGGSEVHMFASYGISVLFCVPVIVFVGVTPTGIVWMMAGHVAISVAVFRYSRAIFLGVDYFLDPGTPPGPDDGGEAARVVRPRVPPSRRGRIGLAPAARGRPCRPQRTRRKARVDS